MDVDPAYQWWLQTCLLLKLRHDTMEVVERGMSKIQQNSDLLVEDRLYDMSRRYEHGCAACTLAWWIVSMNALSSANGSQGRRKPSLWELFG
jgi:hypothetical protein